MSIARILVVCSNYYQDLSANHLEHCLRLLQASKYQYEVEIVEAGAYEIPAVIRAFHQKRPYDAYISLGLLLKGSTDHYQFILDHVRECFIQLTMSGVLLGDGNIYAPSMELLKARVENGERALEAFKAVDYLLKLKEKQKD